MSFSILPIPPFDRQLKRLSKKYPSLKAEYLHLIESLEQNPEQGTKLGNNCYKIRLSIASKGKGKSGGAWVITNFVITDHTVYLLAVYDKSEKETLTDKELAELLKYIPV
jgi:hypothetical protein